MGRWSSDYVPLTDAERNQDKKLNDVNKAQEAVKKLAAEALRKKLKYQEKKAEAAAHDPQPIIRAPKPPPKAPPTSRPPSSQGIKKPAPLPAIKSPSLTAVVILTSLSPSRPLAHPFLHPSSSSMQWSVF